MSPFDNVAKLFTEDDVDIVAPYMVNRILSFIPETCMLAIRMNRFSTRLPKDIISACYNLSIQKRRRRPYIHYPKRAKIKNQKLRAKIRQTFCVNDYHADQIIQLLKNSGGKPEQFYGLKEGE